MIDSSDYQALWVQICPQSNLFVWYSRAPQPFQVGGLQGEGGRGGERGDSFVRGTGTCMNSSAHYLWKWGQERPRHSREWGYELLWLLSKWGHEPLWCSMKWGCACTNVHVYQLSTHAARLWIGHGLWVSQSARDPCGTGSKIFLGYVKGFISLTDLTC